MNETHQLQHGMSWKRFPSKLILKSSVFLLPHSCRVSLSKNFFLWKSRIILIRVMMIMPSLIKVMEVIMTGIITQLAMEAIISIAV